VTIQKLNTSRSVATRSTYVGEKGRLFYDETDGILYLSDGRTPGGILISGGSAAAGTLTGNTLASGVISSSLTSVGTLTGLTVSGNTQIGATTATEKLDVSGGGMLIRGTTAQTNGNGGLYIDTQGTNSRLTAINPGIQWYNLQLTANQISLSTQNAVQFRVTHTASAVNFLQVTGSATGVAPSIIPAGTDSTIGLTLQMKGAGILQVNSGGMNLLKSSQAFNNVAWNGSSATRTDNNATAPDNTTTATLVQATAALYGGLVRQYMSAPYLYASYATYTMSFYAKAGTWNYVGLRMSGGQSGASDAYPYFNLSNGVATNIAPTTGTTFNVGMTNAGNGWYQCYASYTTASVTNSITDIAIVTSAGLTSFTPAGTETVYIWGAQVEFGSVMNTYLVTTLTTPVYNTPSIGFNNSSGLNLGMQSDGSLYFMNGGYEGALQAHATTNGLPAGGNARGLGAVDWQMRRGNAINVASGQESVIGGGYGNTVSGYQSVVAGGAANTNSGGGSFIGAGVGNSTSGLSNMVLAGGGYNTTNSYYSFIGGGSYNTAGVNSAATTQTTTALGIVATSTTVTLSATNATIRVGMLVFGGGVNYPNYVTAISGTTLTIRTAAIVSSSTAVTLNFFETHNIVIGGSNNRSTGVLSFVGGGGDAGTSTNGNVASGDWSTIVGGRKNIASGIASFVGGGGYDGGLLISNTASGIASSVVGGFGNTALGYGSAVLGGANNFNNGAFASIVSGSYGHTRGMQSVLVISSGAPISYNGGTSQASFLVLGVQTTDATSTVLRSDQSTGGSTNQLYLMANSAYYFKGSVIAGITGGGDTKAWTFEGAVKKGAANSIAFVGTPILNVIAQDAGASTWTVALGSSPTFDTVVVTVTGQAATTIRWVCKIETTEMSFYGN
jgi:hypothetical protein